ncbi:hypothetical protein H8E77_08045, partial [bacterium]|nr:hypothetical protein [bacterium]
MRLSLLVAMVGVIALAVGIFDGRAFHKNVDAGCNACHTMHASQDGELSPPTPQKHLIAVEGEGCLACHEFDDQAPDVYGSSPELPGGDYEYSVNDYTTGHNPIGGGDPVLGLTPPGGTTLENWSCNSCHDTYGGFEYRLLRKDPGHLGNDLDGVIIATNEDESEIWDGSANVDQSSSNHNVYRTDIIGDKEVGFGRWCAACHPYFHGGDRSDPEVGDGSDWIRHPTATS